MTRAPRRVLRLSRLGTAACAAVSVLVVAGCQGAYDLPLPGGAAGGGDVYRVTAEFADVQDLVPQSSVKVDEVTVGSVEKIELNGWTARVTLRLPRSVKLPDNAVAELKQTSLLGEKYVELSPPTQTAPVGSLGDGDNIPLARTGRNPEVEEVLSAMSLLLNGGGVAQLKIIETELNKAMHGNEPQIRDLITQLNTFVGGLDAQKSEIVRALDNIDTLTARIAAQKDDLGKALDTLPQGLKVLADQRQQLTTMLASLSRLGAVGTRVIAASKEDTLANLRSLAPVLANLTKAGDNLPKSMQLLLTYPFPDAALQTMRGDYTNLYITSDMNLKSTSGNLGGPTPAPSGGPSVPSLPLPVPSPPGKVPVPVPVPTTSKPCITIVCLGEGAGAGGGQSGTNPADWSWLSLFQTGGAA